MSFNTIFMKHKYLTLILLASCLAGIYAFAQTPPEKDPLAEAKAIKREARKNLIVKEWNTDAKSKTRWLDHQTTYDELGRKIEEIEYTQYGQKFRETYEYGDNDKIVKEIVYDERNKPSLIRKYEYNSQNKKIRQYNYAPNGKLMTIKVFEYITEEL